MPRPETTDDMTYDDATEGERTRSRSYWGFFSNGATALVDMLFDQLDGWQRHPLLLIYRQHACIPTNLQETIISKVFNSGF